MHCIVLFFILNEYRTRSVRYLVYPVNLMDSVYLVAHIVIEFIVHIVIEFIVHIVIEFIVHIVIDFIVLK